MSVPEPYDPAKPHTDRRGVQSHEFYELDRRVGVLETQVANSACADCLPDDIESRLTYLEQEMEKVIESFPEKAHEIHKKAHEFVTAHHKARKEKEADALKQWKELKSLAIKTLAGSVIAGIVTIAGLGLRAQLKIWVAEPLDTPRAQVEGKK